jgi:hypothetical protein
MVTEASILVLLFIGVGSGIISGFFGVGGGIVIVPALVYLVHFSQHKATGTSLAILLPPVGLASVIEYYRHGNVDLRVALIIAIGLFFGAWAGAHVANKIAGPYLRLAFGLFVACMGFYLIYGALKRLAWI